MLTITEAILLVTLYGGNKTSKQIQEHYARRAGTIVPLGTFYLVMARLEREGLVTSRMGDATPERGGNRSKVYNITIDGMRAVDAFRVSIQPE